MQAVRRILCNKRGIGLSCGGALTRTRSCPIMGSMPKRPLDIDEMMVRIRAAVAPFRKAAMFELADDGYASLFEQLVACIISIRTYDEATVPIARRLFDRARTPAAMAQLTVDEIAALIRPSTFYERKAAQILSDCTGGAGKIRW